MIMAVGYSNGQSFGPRDDRTEPWLYRLLRPVQPGAVLS
jgi:hypothetical protein